MAKELPSDLPPRKSCNYNGQSATAKSAHTNDTELSHRTRLSTSQYDRRPTTLGKKQPVKDQTWAPKQIYRIKDPHRAKASRRMLNAEHQSHEHSTIAKK